MENEILLKILEKLETLEKGQTELRTDITTVKTEIVDMKSDIAGMKSDISGMKDDIATIKEDTNITRSAVNTLLDWAEEAQIEVKIPLYKKAE